MGSTLPLIGVTTSRKVNADGLSFSGEGEAYISALLQAEACPVLIPLGLPEAHLQELIRRVDGIYSPAEATFILEDMAQSCTPRCIR